MKKNITKIKKITKNLMLDLFLVKICLMEKIKLKIK